MARKAREKSELGTYMVNLKSIDEISFSALDKANFLNILAQDKISLLAYTLLDKSFLLVIKETDTTLDNILRNASIKFVKSYNKAHSRKGKIFYGRYISFPANSVDETWSLVANVHYIASTSPNALSSVNDYFHDKYIGAGFALDHFGTEEKFIQECGGQTVTEQKIKLSDNELRLYIENTFRIQPHRLSQMPQSLVEKMLTQIFKATKASVRQIARISSLPLRMLWDMAKKIKPSKSAVKTEVRNESKG